MSYTLTGSWTIECDTLSSYRTILAGLGDNTNISSIVGDENLLTITCDVNATG